MPLTLRWDPRNAAHIARHGVTMQEVQEVCDGDHVIRSGHSGRMVVVGPTRAGRMVAAVLEAELGGLHYPVSARPARRDERRQYEQAMSAEDP